MINDWGAGAGEDNERDVPLVLGSVTTCRWMTVTSRGLIASPFQFGHVFSPSRKEHTAECLYSITYGPFYDQYKVRSRRQEHVATASCVCGYYSFYEPPTALDLVPPGDNGNVGAVVECYGRITYGELGMRASHLKIKAIVTNPFPRLTLARAHSHHLLKRFKWLGLFMLMLAFSVLWMLPLFLVQVLTGLGDPWLMYLGYPLGAASVPVWIWAVANRVAAASGYKESQITTKRLKMLRANYPDVAIYETWEEAERHFPITKRKDMP